MDFISRNNVPIKIHVITRLFKLGFNLNFTFESTILKINHLCMLLVVVSLIIQVTIVCRTTN